MDARWLGIAAVGVLMASCGRPATPVDPSPLGELVRGAERARLVEVDGRAWIALGDDPIPVVPWDGPQHSDCEEPPAAEPDRRDPPGLWFVPEAPALLVLDADTLTVWAVDPQERCAVPTELLDDPLTLEDGITEELLWLDVSGAAGSLDARADTRVDVLPIPGLESAALSLDSATVNTADGELILGRTLAEAMVGDPLGFANSTLSLSGDGADGAFIRIESYLDASDPYESATTSESLTELLIWRPEMAQATLLYGDHTWTNTSGDEDSRVEEGTTLTRAWLVPGGALIAEVEDVRTLFEDRVYMDDEPRCTRTSTADEAHWEWRVERDTGTDLLWSGETLDEELSGDCPEDSPGGGDDPDLPDLNGTGDVDGTGEPYEDDSRDSNGTGETGEDPAQDGGGADEP